MHPFSVKKFASLAVLSSFFLLTHHVFSVSASPASPATAATAATDEAALDAAVPTILPKNTTTPNDNVTSDALKTTDKSPPKTNPALNSTSLKKPSASKHGGNETIFGLLKTLNAQGISIDPHGLKNVNFVKLVSTLAQIIQYSTEGFSLGNDTTPLSKGPMVPGPGPGEIRLMFTLDPKFLSTNIVKFLHFPDRLEQPLNATLVKGLVEKVNDSGLFKNKFSPVPRAFATIVNRKEVASLEKSAGIGIDEVVKIARENYIAYTQISIQCLAWDSATGLLFLRVRAKEWTMTRKDLFNLLKKKKNDTSEETLKRDIFNPDLYSPGVVIATSLNSTVGEESFDHLALNNTKCLALVDASPVDEDEEDDLLSFQSSATFRNGTSSNDTLVNGTVTNGTSPNATVTNGTVTNATVTNATVTDATVTDATVTNGTSSIDSTNSNDVIVSSTNTNANNNTSANNTSANNTSANSTSANSTNTNSTDNATSA